MKRIILYSVSILFITLFASSCKNEKIDLSKINVKVEVNRFDRSIFSIDTNKLQEVIPALSKKYGYFFQLFGEGIISIGKPSDPQFQNYLGKFLANEMVLNAYKNVQAKFPNMDKLNVEFTDAFKRYHYYFPKRYIPSIYTFVSGYNQSTILADSILGIGLDRYLGADYKDYVNLGIPKYSIKHMKPEKISSDCMRAWAIGEFSFNDSIDNLINNVIYEGKLMYFTKKLLPDQPDSLIFGFSPKQMKWCFKNEKQMWTYLIENKLLFTSDSFLINKYINDAPFTSGFTQESPGRAIVWLGYRIVETYAKNNKSVTFPQLMATRDYQKIFSQSKYRP